MQLKESSSGPDHPGAHGRDRTQPQPQGLPDLLVDGRCCCDQMAVHRLAKAGLIAGAGPATLGRRVPARLTPAGRQELLAG